MTTSQPSSIHPFDPDAVAGVCEAFHVLRLALFGSAVRTQLRPDSDIDLLVDFEPGHVPGMVGLGQLSDALSPHFGNRPMDLVRPDSLHWYVKNTVLDSSQVIYER